jgi:hypothetical protein
VPGYQLTDDETAGVLDASEQRTQAHQWYHAGVPVEPALSEPIFGSDGREAGEPVLYPLTSACRCGRQITKERIDVPWIHSD